MLLCAYCGLHTVGVARIHLGVVGSPLFAAVFSQRDVKLFIHGLQLGVETTYHHVLETVALYACPVLNLVGRNVFYIASYVV